MAMKRFDLEFNKHGQMHDASQMTKLLAGLDGVTDLLVVSHGWNNDMADARAFYDKLLGNIDRLLALRAHAQFTHLAPLAPRVFAACQLFWPSKKFTEEELIPGGGPASAENGGRNDAALETVLDRLAENPDRLGDRNSPPVRKELVRRAKELIPELERSERARADLVSRLRELLDPDHASRDDASIEFFTEEAATLFRHFEGEVIAPGTVSKGGATAVDVGAGAAATLIDARQRAEWVKAHDAEHIARYPARRRQYFAGAVGRDTI